MAGDIHKALFPSISCHLSRIEDGGGSLVTLLEIIEGVVKVNGTSHVSGKRLLIKYGDELKFDNSSYIFLQSSLRSLNLKDLELAQSFREEWEENLKKSIIHADVIDASLENFPYFISDATKQFLIASTRLHLDEKFSEVKKLAPKIQSVTQRILLSGPADMYQEALAKSIAKYFKARLLIVDSASLLSGGTHVKEVGYTERPKIIRGPQSLKEGSRVQYYGDSARGPKSSAMGTVLITFEDKSLVGVKFDDKFPGGNDLGGLCDVGHGYFCHDFLFVLKQAPPEAGDFQKNLIKKIVEFASNESKSGPLIVFFKDIMKMVVGESHNLQKIVECLPHNIVLIASCINVDTREIKTQATRINEGSTVFESQEKPKRPQPSKPHDEIEDKQINSLFPNKLTIQLPKDQASLTHWKQQLEEHNKSVDAQFKFAIIRASLNKIGFKCPDLEDLCIKDQTLTVDNVDKVVEWAIGSSEDFIEEDKLVISSKSINHGLSILESTQSANKDFNSLLKGVITENEFEKQLLADVIPPADIDTTFENIGALETVKETLKELVMLPLQRPELFTRGNLAKPCKGILLFGPPGTGKTMLAKAVAKESGANFIDVSVSTISSKWVGEAEKYVKAVFSLANKIAPCVVFIDEVDSLLGDRGSNSSSSHEVHHKMKTEFFIHWDGLRTQENNRVTVLAATNRPFDLDEAVIRRLPRRLMVSLPDASNREKILKVLLAEENLSSDVDLKALAGITNGYSGNDLKDLCVAAAHCPLRETLEKEEKEKNLALAEDKPLPGLSSSSDLRPVNMDDFLYAQKQVCASVEAESPIIYQLLQWNDSFGGGGGKSRKSRNLSYFV